MTWLSWVPDQGEKKMEGKEDAVRTQMLAVETKKPLTGESAA
jgi:hypothetical protein